MAHGRCNDAKIEGKQNKCLFHQINISKNSTWENAFAQIKKTHRGRRRRPIGVLFIFPSPPLLSPSPPSTFPLFLGRKRWRLGWGSGDAETIDVEDVPSRESRWSFWGLTDPKLDAAWEKIEKSKGNLRLTTGIKKQSRNGVYMVLKLTNLFFRSIHRRNSLLWWRLLSNILSGYKRHEWWMDERKDEHD